MESSSLNKVLFASYVIVALISLWIAAMYFCLKHDGIAKSYFLAASVIGFLLILLLPVAGSYPYFEVPPIFMDHHFNSIDFACKWGN